MSKSKEPIVFEEMVANKLQCPTCMFGWIYKSKVPWEDMDAVQCPHCGTNMMRIPTKRIGTYSAKGSGR